MSELIERLNRKALELGIPLGAHVDLTWRCNERCIHCYLDHDDPDRLSLAEVRGILDQLADAGVFFLTLSGGEIFLRKDLREIVGHARLRGFDIKLKTNGILMTDADADWIAALGVRQVQISVYSHRAEVHDAITKVPGSLARSIRALEMIKDRGVHAIVACVLMKPNAGDRAGVRELARRLGAEFTIDPTITPHISGDRAITALNISRAELAEVFRDEELVGDVAAYCAPPAPVSGDTLDETPCSAGHTSCYIAPNGDVYPCVQFPLTCGNVLRERFLDIWQRSPQFKQVRAIRARDLPVCSTCSHVGSCSRCPGLAFMEGNMYGPSSSDCEKSFVRTGIPPASGRPLFQILPSGTTLV
jgi:radical SAM protein with 4Fe4S-binding SPASM domain